MVTAPNFCQHRVGEDAVVPLGKGPPGFRNHAVLFHQRQGIFLLEEGVQLNLVDGGGYLYRLTQVGQTVGVEVAHANGFQLALPVGLFHSAVCANIVAHGLMDEIQVDIIQAKVAQRGFNGLFGTLVAGILHPKLGGDEQLFPRHATFLNCGAHSLFIHIGGCCVNQTVTGGDGIQHCLLANCGVWHLKHAESFQRHFYSIV